MPCSVGAEGGPALAAVGHASPATEPLSLVVVCAWCGRPIGRGAISSHKLVSHGICRPCSDDMKFSESAELLLRR
jgi:hypothetical protein